MAVRGLCCRSGAFSSCGECRLLSGCGAQASHRSGFSCCEACVLECWLSRVAHGLSHSIRGMWDLPGAGIEPISPVLADRLSTTGPPGTPSPSNLWIHPHQHFAWCTLCMSQTSTGDNIQPWRTPFPILNQSIVPCPVLTVASWSGCRFLRRQIRWSSSPLSLRIFHSLLWLTQRF